MKKKWPSLLTLHPAPEGTETTPFLCSETDSAFCPLFLPPIVYIDTRHLIVRVGPAHPVSLLRNTPLCRRSMNDGAGLYLGDT